MAYNWGVNKSRPSQQKRQRERQKQERRTEKLARRQEVLPLFRAARIERFAWDVEILYLARKTGVRVREVPVLWRNAAGTLPS